MNNPAPNPPTPNPRARNADPALSRGPLVTFPLPSRTIVAAVLGVAAGLLLAAQPAAALPEVEASTEARAEVQERQVERRVWKDGEGNTRVVEIEADDGSVSGNAVFVSDDGEGPVKMELEPDGEGGYHWVQRDSEGRLVEVREIDEIAAPGDPRVRAVFIGEGAAPVELACDDEDGEDCSGMSFAYKVLPESFGVGRGYLGVAATELTPELRAHFGAPEEAGVLVARVAAESPAGLAGVRVGDVITALDGETIASGFDLHRRVRGFEEGDSATLEVVRSGRVLALDVRLAERAVPEVDMSSFFLRPKLGEHRGPRLYQLSPDGVEKHLVRIQKRLDSPELQRDVTHLRGVENDLEQRIEELERRIEELTTALGEDG